MNSLSIYLVKTTFCLAFFYGLYMLLLRKETFFGFNRIYLLGSLFASFIIPLIRLELFSWVSGDIPVMIINLAPEYIPVLSTRSETVLTGTGFSWSSLLMILYFTVSLLIIARLLRFTILWTSTKYSFGTQPISNWRKCHTISNRFWAFRSKMVRL